MVFNYNAAPEAIMQTFPPTNGGDRGRGYQTLESPSGMLVMYFRIACYDSSLIGDNNK